MSAAKMGTAHAYLELSVGQNPLGQRRCQRARLGELHSFGHLCCEPLAGAAQLRFTFGRTLELLCKTDERVSHFLQGPIIVRTRFGKERGDVMYGGGGANVRGLLR